MYCHSFNLSVVGRPAVPASGAVSLGQPFVGRIPHLRFGCIVELS